MSRFNRALAILTVVVAIGLSGSFLTRQVIAVAGEADAERLSRAILAYIAEKNPRAPIKPFETFPEVLVSEAARTNVDHCLILAQAEVESEFRHDAVGRAGGDELRATGERGLERHRPHIAYGQLARDGEPARPADDRPRQHLVEIRRHDPAVSRPGWALVTAVDQDRRDDAAFHLEAPHAQAARVRLAAAETARIDVARARGGALLLEPGEALAEDLGQRLRHEHRGAVYHRLIAGNAPGRPPGGRSARAADGEEDRCGHASCWAPCSSRCCWPGARALRRRCCTPTQSSRRSAKTRPSGTSKRAGRSPTST